MRRAFGWWLISRLGYLLISVVQLYLPWRYPPLNGQPLILTEWDRYDARFYLQIATHGYHTAYLANWPFLFPLLVHVLAWLPGGALTAGLLVANVSSLAGLLGLARLQSSVPGDSRAQLAILAYPLAFFLAAPWAMSLLVCLSVWCFVCIERRMWSLAALCVFLAVLDADIGVCLAIPLVVSWVQQVADLHGSHTRWQQLVVEPSVVMLGAPLGLLVWCMYQFMHYHGDVLSFHDQFVYFGHHFVAPPVGLWLIASNVVSVTLHHPADLLRLLMDVLPFAGVLAISVYASIRRLWPLHQALYVFALLTLIAITPVQHEKFPDVIVSAGRYLLAAIPIWLLLPRLFADHRRIGIALLIASCCLQLVLTIAYLRGGWIV